MSTRTASSQIAFRYRAVDSETGVTRETAKRLASDLGVDETQALVVFDDDAPQSAIRVAYGPRQHTTTTLFASRR